MSDYEPCGICGYDHEYDYALPGVADLILQAHLDDGLLSRINVDRASRNEPPWSRQDLANALADDPALFDSVHAREPVDVMPPPDARAFAIMQQLFGPADKNGIIHIPRR